MDIRKKDFQIELKEGLFKDYEKNILAANLCKYFIPMSFVNYKEKDLVTYDCSGYSALNQCEVLTIGQLLDILEKIFIILSKTGEYLILPSRVVLNEETVFFNAEKNCVKIAYVPMENEQTSLRENILGFISILEKKVPEDMKGYLDKIKTFIDKNNYYVKDVTNVILQMKRELHICGLR